MHKRRSLGPGMQLRGLPNAKETQLSAFQGEAKGRIIDDSDGATFSYEVLITYFNKLHTYGLGNRRRPNLPNPLVDPAVFPG